MFTQEELNQLYRYALSISAREDLAYDLLQESLERYLRKCVSIEKPVAYLKTIIRNLYIDWQRHNKVLQMVSIESDEVASIEPINDGLMDDLLVHQQEVEQLVSGLSSAENELLYLWAVEEHTVDEIARIYEKPRGTILSQLHRLKKRIKKQFASQSESEAYNQALFSKTGGDQ